VVKREKKTKYKRGSLFEKKMAGGDKGGDRTNKATRRKGIREGRLGWTWRGGEVAPL